MSLWRERSLVFMSPCSWKTKSLPPNGLSRCLRQLRICLQCRKPRFDPWVGKIPWRREKLPISVFLGNPLDRRVWRATVYRVAMNQTWLNNNTHPKQIAFPFMFSLICTYIYQKKKKKNLREGCVCVCVCTRACLSASVLFVPIFQMRKLRPRKMKWFFYWNAACVWPGPASRLC